MGKAMGGTAKDKEMAEPRSMTVKVALPSPDTFPPAGAANYFAVSRVGAMVQLLVGFVDLHATATFAEAVRKGEMNADEPADPLRVMVTHRTVLDALTLVTLKGKIDQMVSIMREDGTIPDEVTP